MARRLIFFAVVLGGALAALSGCRAKIGDACKRSTDCSITGGRICDLSHRVNKQGQPHPRGSGECIIEGCGRGTCPDEAACVKVYGSDFLSVACDPAREDRATFGPDGEPLPPLDECAANEVCLPEGLCADEITARRSCRKKCKSDDDCRAGYECVRTGSRGIYRAPDLSNPSNHKETRICTPVVR